MNYVYDGKVFEVDFTARNLNDEIEIFLIDPDTRETISIYDLPDHAQDDLWSACSDVVLEEATESFDMTDFDMGEDS